MKYTIRIFGMGTNDTTHTANSLAEAKRIGSLRHLRQEAQQMPTGPLVWAANPSDNEWYGYDNRTDLYRDREGDRPDLWRAMISLTKNLESEEG